MLYEGKGIRIYNLTLTYLIIMSKPLILITAKFIERVDTTKLILTHLIHSQKINKVKKFNVFGNFGCDNFAMAIAIEPCRL